VAGATSSEGFLVLYVFAGLLLVVGIGIVLGIVLGFSMLAVAVTIIKR